MATAVETTRQRLAEAADDRAMILDLFRQAQVTLAEIDAAFADWMAAYEEKGNRRIDREDAEARKTEAEAEATLAAQVGGVLTGSNAETRKMQLTAHLAELARDLSQPYGQALIAHQNASNAYDAAVMNETIALKRYEMALARAKLIGSMLGVFARP